MILPSLINRDANQVPWTNIPITTNCAKALNRPHTLNRRLTAIPRDSKARVACLSSKSWALKALTVDMAVRARSRSAAVEVVSNRSRRMRGAATDCEIDWMRIKKGTADRMTRVSAHERMKARIRQAKVVVRYWMKEPVAREVAIRISLVSLKANQ